MGEIVGSGLFAHADRPHIPGVIAEMAEARRKPRSIASKDLIPAHVREAYEQRWQAEDRAMLAAAAPRGGWLRRLCGAIANVW